MRETMYSSSTEEEEGAELFLDEFPIGLRILLVDDDRISLAVLEKQLQSCLYQVTRCQQPGDALALIQEDKSRFDVLVVDLHMPDMDGLELIEHIKHINGVELDLPIVMVSSDDNTDAVMKGVLIGACDYLIKPVKLDALRLLWQHVLRKKRNFVKDFKGPTCSKDDNRPDQLIESYHTGSKRRKDDADIAGEAPAATGKRRMVWTKELHEKFVRAVNHLGREKAVPMKILECMRRMNVSGITRENIASHLQKYRMHLRETDDIPGHRRDRFIPPSIARTSVYGLSPSLETKYSQYYSNMVQFSEQNLINLQTGVPPIFTANSSVNMSFDDQSNHLYSEVVDSSCYSTNRSLGQQFSLATGVEPSNRIPESNYHSITKSSALECTYAAASAVNSSSSKNMHSVCDSYDNTEDVTPVLIHDPSLYLKHDRSEMFPIIPFCQEDGEKSLRIDYDVDW